MSLFESYFWAIIAVAVVITSLANVVLYGLDKRRSRQNGRRIPEKTFHILGLFGGWPGAAIGGSLFRHKTKKLSYRLVFWGVAIVNCAGLWSLWWLLREIGA